MGGIEFLYVPPLVGVVAVFMIVVAGAMVQAGLGMGMGLMAAPLLALIAPALVPVPVLWMGCATAAWTAFIERDAISWPEVGIALLGRIGGVAAGLGLLGLASGVAGFSLVFGIMVGLAVLISAAGWRLPFTRGAILSMGALSGAMSTVTSVGAPPMAMVYQSRPATAARPTLSAFFAIGAAMSLAGLYHWGHAGRADTLHALAMLPPMILGLRIAGRMRHRFDRRYRPVLLAVSGGAAILLIVRGLA